MSDFSWVYFSFFLALAESIFLSKLQVSSSTKICFSFLLINTKSGLDVVGRISGGMVEPFRSDPGISAYTSRSCEDE